jgi:phospholipid/cholesterol/gamma-HCH transport system substrate-binding protein
MVLLGVAVAAILVLIFGGGPQALRGQMTIHMVFTEAPMVLKDTPVKKSGVVIGRVYEVALLDDGRVSITAKIDDDKPVFTTDVARITASLIGGDAAVNLEPGRKPVPRERVKDGAEIEGLSYTDPIQVIGNLQDRLSGAIGSITSTSTELGRVIHQVGELVQTNQERINRIVAQADDASRDAKETVRSLNEVFGNPETKAKLKDAADQLPDLIRTTRQTVGDAGKVMAGFNQNLTNLDAFTAALKNQGPPLMSRLGDSAETLDRLSKEMLTLTRNINEGKGTLGVLATDRELYDNLNRTVTNIEALSRELRPILRDARVFTDSIARHPEKLGVRGALQPSSGTKW